MILNQSGVPRTLAARMTKKTCCRKACKAVLWEHYWKGGSWNVPDDGRIHHLPKASLKNDKLTAVNVRGDDGCKLHLWEHSPDGNGMGGGKHVAVGPGDYGYKDMGMCDN